MFWSLGWRWWWLFSSICFKDSHYACVSPCLVWGVLKGQVTTCTASTEKPFISKALIVFKRIQKRSVFLKITGRGVLFCRDFGLKKLKRGW